MLLRIATTAPSFWPGILIYFSLYFVAVTKSATSSSLL